MFLRLPCEIVLVFRRVLNSENSTYGLGAASCIGTRCLPRAKRRIDIIRSSVVVHGGGEEPLRELFWLAATGQSQSFFLQLSSESSTETDNVAKLQTNRQTWRHGACNNPAPIGNDYEPGESGQSGR